MRRREFLHMMALASLAAAGSTGSADAGAPDKKPPPGVGPKVKVALAALAQGSDQAALRQAVRQAASVASDFAWLSRGDAVFIKPALNSGNPYPATSSPVAIAAMVELLKEKGAGRVIVGDMSGIEHVKLTPDGLKGSTRQLAVDCGIGPAASAAGAELYFPEEDGWQAFFEETPAAGSSWKAGLMMPKVLQEVEHIVLMPRCGRHVLAGSTLGLKAAVGYWRTDTRLEYHHDAASFQEKTAEGNTVPSLLDKQRLVLTLADKILTTFGPDKGLVSIPQTGLVIASDSVVAHDMVSLAWLLEHHRALSEGQKGLTDDPYSSQLVVNLANHWVAGKLGGWGPAFTAQKLVRNDIASIWDDRVLNQAYRVMGGLPRLELEPAGKMRAPDVLLGLGRAVDPGAR
jgi:uncharacterized protein (DUF362 family)